MNLNIGKFAVLECHYENVSDYYIDKLIKYICQQGVDSVVLTLCISDHLAYRLNEYIDTYTLNYSIEGLVNLCDIVDYNEYQFTWVEKIQQLASSIYEVDIDRDCLIKKK